MKKIYLLLAVVTIVVSCGKTQEKSVQKAIDSNNIKELRDVKNVVENKQQEIEAQLKRLDEKIAELDTIKNRPLITTLTIKDTIFNHYLELQGNVSTKQNIVISPEISGILQRVFVKEGQFVTKGQALAKIDDSGMSQQVAQLQIQADLAKTTFERQERLWNQKIGSEIQYLQAKSNYEAQAKAVSQLQTQLAKTIVKAPFSGTIDDVITDQGSVVAPGQTQLMRIVNLNNMYIETDVPESYIVNVTKNKMVLVEFPILGKTIEASVRQAGNFINPANRTFKVEIAIPNKDKSIKPNLTAKLKINDYTNEKALLIPLSIISEDANGKQYIYVIKNKKEDIAIAEQVFIETGRTQGDVIEVLKGIQDGSEIINEGARSITNLQEVKIKMQ